MKAKSARGFSLVEIVFALSLFVFAILVMLPLLPMGIKSNQVSLEETTAAGFLTAPADHNFTDKIDRAFAQELFDA